MSIAFKDVFEVLAMALPGCPPEEDDWEEPLAYILMQEMLSFVCRQTDLGNTAVVTQFSVLLEKLVSEGDFEVQNLAKDALDGLLDCKSKDNFAQYFEPKVKVPWKDALDDFYRG